MTTNKSTDVTVHCSATQALKYPAIGWHGYTVAFCRVAME